MKQKFTVVKRSSHQLAKGNVRKHSGNPSDDKLPIALRLANASGVSSDGDDESGPESGWLNFRRKPFERETSAQCEKWQKRNIRLLSRGSPAHRALGEKLQACTDRNPCASEACLLCMYDFRTRLLEQSVQMLHSQKWTAASIITRNMQVALGELGSFDVIKHVRRLQKQIERSKVLRDCLIIGGLDISLNKISGRIQCWQVHLYLLIANPKTLKLRVAVRKAFPEQLSVRVPYRFRQVVDRLEAISYSYKSVFNIRHSYLNDDLEARVDRDPIPDFAKPELLAFLDSYAIGGRMLLRGLRRHGRRLNLKPVPKRGI